MDPEVEFAQVLSVQQCQNGGFYKILMLTQRFLLGFPGLLLLSLFFDLLVQGLFVNLPNEFTDTLRLIRVGRTVRRLLSFTGGTKDVFLPQNMTKPN